MKKLMMSGLGMSIFVLTLALGLGLTPAARAAGDGVSIGQTDVVLGVGQSISLVSFNGSNLTAKSTKNVVRASVYGGNQISLVGLRVGAATVNVCSNDLGCTAVSVKIQKAKVPVLKVSSSNVQLMNGQIKTVTVSNGNDVVASSNSGAVTTIVNVDRIYLTGKFNGNATVTVCSSNKGCIPLFVKVKGALPKPPANPVQPPTQSQNLLQLNTANVTLDRLKTFDVIVETKNVLTARSNSDAVRTAVNGSRVTLYAMLFGEATVTICDTSILCSTVKVKVVGPTVISTSAQTNQTNVAVKQRGSFKSVSVNAGQSVDFPVPSNALTTYSLARNSNPSAVSAEVKANHVYLSGLNNGTALLTLCPSSSWFTCGTIGVTVGNL